MQHPTIGRHPTGSTTAWYAGRGSWTLRESPVPVPGPEQLLVRTEAVALNNADAEPAVEGAESVAGYEVAGQVVEVGSPALQDLLGSRVAGTTPGAFAAHVAVDHRWVLQVPDGLDPSTAAALPTALLTEHGALTAAGFVRGDSVLITGATSSIGLVGVQAARALGASRVVATTRSADKRDLLARAGADLVVVTESDDDLVAALRDAPVQVVLDHVGAQTFAACLQVTAVGGTVVNVGRLAGPVAELDLTELAAADVTLRAVSYGFADPDQIGQVLAAAARVLLPLVADGQVRPVVDRVYDFADANDALERLRSGDAVGKLVLSLSSG